MNGHSFLLMMAMATQTALEKKPSDKRAKIIQAAINVFAKQGFYNSTVNHVAKEAQVADGTIYLYFKNKDDLLISIFEHSIDIFIQAATKTLTNCQDAQEKLRVFLNLHLELVKKNQNLAQVIQIELRQSAKFMKEYANEKFFDYLGIVEQILIEGQKEGLFRADLKPQILKRAIFGAIDELASEWVLMRKKRYQISEAAEQLIGMVLGGILMNSTP